MVGEHERDRSGPAGRGHAGVVVRVAALVVDARRREARARARVYGVAVGVGLSYSMLGDLLNSSTIIADAHMLVVRHGPISMRRTMRLRVREITRIGCREVESNTTRHGQPALTYSVCARTLDGRRIDLLDNLPDVLFDARP